MAKPHLLTLLLILSISLNSRIITSQKTYDYYLPFPDNQTQTVVQTPPNNETQTQLSNQVRRPPDNETVYRVSKTLCWGCIGESIQFLFAHNLARARKLELPLAWSFQLESYARWWASQRQSDCALQHSFKEGQFTLGENIFWGGGSGWTPSDAVNAWTDEEKYYTYSTNSCVEGQMCGHYTQVVWRSTKWVGCARVVCNNGDVFMTCNYDPPGNYIGERPY